MTIRMSFLVSGKRAQSGEALGRTAAQTCTKCRYHRRLQITHGGYPRERGQHESSKAEQNSRAEAGTAATQRPGDDLRGADRPQSSAGSATDRFVPFADRKSERNSGPDAERERR